MSIVVEQLKKEDWKAIKSIYQEGIATGNATFETEVPEWKEWDKNHLKICRLVAKKQGQVIGWAAISPVSDRPIYRGVGEVSIYITTTVQGQGIGHILLRAIIEESEKEGIWTLQAGIFPENVASIALHKACEFREVGFRERIGLLKGIWRDVILMERRSKIVGI
ncbi:MAG: GNAT family N-acetyltransferase [Candidatus Hermodarchaeota archaeon]